MDQNNVNNQPEKQTSELKKETISVNNLSLTNLPPLLTIREAAAILRVSPLTLKRWGKRGKLIPIRINSRGDRRYKKEAILWMLNINP